MEFYVLYSKVLIIQDIKDQNTFKIDHFVNNAQIKIGSSKFLVKSLINSLNNKDSKVNQKLKFSLERIFFYEFYGINIDKEKK